MFQLETKSSTKIVHVKVRYNKKEYYERFKNNLMFDWLITNNE